MAFLSSSACTAWQRQLPLHAPVQVLASASPRSATRRDGCSRSEGGEQFHGLPCSVIARHNAKRYGRHPHHVLHTPRRHQAAGTHAGPSREHVHLVPNPHAVMPR